MLINLSKMYNKILCLVYGELRTPMKIMFRVFLIRRVNQQVTLFFPSFFPYLSLYFVEKINYAPSQLDACLGGGKCNNGTSETACDITFNFNNYLNLKPLHKKKLNQRFLEWFIGFTEGKGSFIILKNKVYFGITQNLDNIQVLYDIKKQLGFGKVLIRKESSPSAYRRSAVIRREGVFYVTPGPKEENFHRLITIFNGNLCSKNKKEEFKN